MKLMTDQINKMHVLLDEINQIYMDNINNIDVRLQNLEIQMRRQKDKNSQMANFLNGMADLMRDNEENY